MSEEESVSAVSEGKKKTTLYCSFCGKSQHEVRKLIAGPTVFICDECVELCFDMLCEDESSSLHEPSEKMARYILAEKILAETSNVLSTIKSLVDEAEKIHERLEALRAASDRLSDTLKKD